jgi:hypothetical protein
MRLEALRIIVFGLSCLLLVGGLGVRALAADRLARLP